MADDDDELILHVQKRNGEDDALIIRELNNRFAAQTEIHPNRIIFHDAAEMRDLLGVGTQLKEQKIADHRARCADITTPEPFPPDTVKARDAAGKIAAGRPNQLKRETCRPIVIRQ